MKTVIVILITILSYFTSFSQTVRTKQADKYFKSLAFVKAAELYSNVVKKDTSAYVLQKLGDSYYYNNKIKQAVKVYGRLLQSYDDVSPEYIFRYSQTLRGVGKYKESRVWLQKFYQQRKNDSRAKSFLLEDESLYELRTKNPDYKAKNLSAINTKYSDFGVAFNRDKILYASAKRKSSFVKRVYAWNNQPFLDIFEATVTKRGKVLNIKALPKKINTIYHESSVAFSPNYKTIYFTRNNYNKNKFGKDGKGENNLKIYKATLNQDSEWDNVEELSFNSDNYSVGHPAMSKDGKTLYFTSNMPGSIGQTDIFYVDISANGTYGKPKNLGADINTEGKEMFPFIAEDGTLYFSSDGHYGLGGLDVFSSKLKEGIYTRPKNLKNPINTRSDDFAFIINPKTKKGYLSSNRRGGKGDDDIYSIVELKKEVEEKMFIEGIVRHAQTKEILPASTVGLFNAKGEEQILFITKDSATFKFLVKPSTSYTLKASKNTFMPNNISLSTVKKGKNQYFELLLHKEEDPDIITKGGNKFLNFGPIYFDFNKATIRNTADNKGELDKIVAIMMKYPKMIVEIGSHTDSKGKDSYNLRLSNKRAKETKEYIISKGISSARIFGKGYGETQLINKCKNRVKCSKDEHQMNRRTDFKVIQM